MISKKNLFGAILGFLMMNVGDFMINMKEKLLYWINRIIYKSNMNHTFSEVYTASKKGDSICRIEYPNATENEIKDIVARLKYLNYDVYFTYISPIPKNPSEIRIKLHA